MSKYNALVASTADEVAVMRERQRRAAQIQVSNRNARQPSVAYRPQQELHVYTAFILIWVQMELDAQQLAMLDLAAAPGDSGHGSEGAGTVTRFPE